MTITKLGEHDVIRIPFFIDHWAVTNSLYLNRDACNVKLRVKQIYVLHNSI